MKIVENGVDRLVVRDSSILGAFVLIAIAIVIGGFGTAGLSAAETSAELVISTIFVAVAAVLVLGASFILRIHIHVFDRAKATLDTRTWRLFGSTDHSIPLHDVINAKVETVDDADNVTHRIVLTVKDHGKVKTLPLRDHTTGARHDRIVHSINEWIQQC